MNFFKTFFNFTWAGFSSSQAPALDSKSHLDLLLDFFIFQASS